MALREGAKHLHEVPLIKEPSDLLDDLGPGCEDTAHSLVVDNTVQIALPIPRLLQTAEQDDHTSLMPIPDGMPSQTVNSTPCLLQQFLQTLLSSPSHVSLSFPLHLDLQAGED